LVTKREREYRSCVGAFSVKSPERRISTLIPYLAHPPSLPEAARASVREKYGEKESKHKTTSSHGGAKRRKTIKKQAY